MQPTTLRQVVDLATKHQPKTLTQAQDALRIVREAFALPKPIAANPDIEEQNRAREADFSSARDLAKAIKGPAANAISAIKPTARKPALAVSKSTAKPTASAPSADRNAAARAALWSQYQTLPTGQARRDFFAKHKAALWQAAREVKL